MTPQKELFSFRTAPWPAQRASPRIQTAAVGLQPGTSKRALKRARKRVNIQRSVVVVKAAKSRVAAKKRLREEAAAAAPAKRSRPGVSFTVTLNNVPTAAVTPARASGATPTRRTPASLRGFAGVPVPPSRASPAGRRAVSPGRGPRAGAAIVTTPSRASPSPASARARASRAAAAATPVRAALPRSTASKGAAQAVAAPSLFANKSSKVKSTLVQFLTSRLVCSCELVPGGSRLCLPFNRTAQAFEVPDGVDVPVDVPVTVYLTDAVKSEHLLDRVSVQAWECVDSTLSQVTVTRHERVHRSDVSPYVATVTNFGADGGGPLLRSIAPTSATLDRLWSEFNNPYALAVHAACARLGASAGNVSVEAVMEAAAAEFLSKVRGFARLAELYQDDF